MRALNLKLWAVLPVILLIHTAPSFAQTVCDAAEVKLGNNFIQVAPAGVDDTANIQCALDLAVEKRIPEIRLTRGDFYISSLLSRGFAGTLQGGGRITLGLPCWTSRSTVEIRRRHLFRRRTAYSLACAGLGAEGGIPAPAGGLAVPPCLRFTAGTM